MNTQIYLRPLELQDADISYKWRNDPDVWRYTKFVSNGQITQETEQKWLINKLNLNNEKRFAICLVETNRYIGNIHLLNITKETAEFHLFIGERDYWGKGIGFQACLILLKFAFINLNLKSISLEVHAENIAAYAIYKKIGFQRVSQHAEFVTMVLSSDVSIATN